MPKVKRAFTLIELLIVISIIGILAGVLVTIIDVSEYQKQARDARRLNDIITIQSALSNAVANADITFVDTTSCSDCTSITGTSKVDGTGWVKFTNVTGTGVSEFIPTLPEDPINDASYRYEFYSNGSKYELNAFLESDRYMEHAAKDGGNNNTVYERGFKLDIN